MKKLLSIGTLSILLLGGCDEQGREGAEEAINAPSDYVGANVRARQQAQVTAATQSVSQAVQQFQAAEGRLPRNLDELVSEDYLPQLPELPDGVSFRYNPQSGEVAVEGY